MGFSNCRYLIITCVLVHLCSAVLSQTSKEPDEQRLYNQILGSYLSTVRPALNDSQPLQVLFSMRLNQIVSLNERQQVLTTNAFIDQTWTDPALVWDPAVFKDVRSLRVPADQIWKPDTFIFNNVNNGSTGFIHGTYIQIRHTGEVTWPIPVRLRSSCVVKIAYFPFDYQLCTVKFGSWIYSYSLVDYIMRENGVSVDLSTYIKNSEWELVSMKLEKSIANRSRGLGLHPYLTAMLFLKRNTFYYLFNIIVPCVMLSMLTLMTFWLPPTSGEKVTLGLSVFLAFSMFMLLIAEEVPASSDAVPVIGIYLCVVMTMTSLSVICAVIVTNLHSRGSKLRPAPRWLASLFIRYLAVPFCVDQDVQLLADTVHLTDYCRFFILHNNRCERMEALNKEIQNSKNNKDNADEPDETTPAKYTMLHQREHMQTATKYSSTQRTKRSSPVCNHRLHNFYHTGEETLREQAVKNELPHKQSDRLRDSSLLCSHTPFISVCDYDERFLPSGRSDDYQLQETAIDAAVPTQVSQDNNLPTCSLNTTTTTAVSSAVNNDNFNDNYYITACNRHEKFCECAEDEEDIWVLREETRNLQTTLLTSANHHDSDSEEEVRQTLIPGPQQTNMSSTTTAPPPNVRQKRKHIKQRDQRHPSLYGNPKQIIKQAKIMIAEWFTIAKVMDRILFTLSLFATISAYIIILIIVPAGNKTALETVT